MQFWCTSTVCLRLPHSSLDIVERMLLKLFRRKQAVPPQNE